MEYTVGLYIKLLHCINFKLFSRKKTALHFFTTDTNVYFLKTFLKNYTKYDI